jgi:hypothetical protein
VRLGEQCCGVDLWMLSCKTCDRTCIMLHLMRTCCSTDLAAEERGGSTTPWLVASCRVVSMYEPKPSCMDSCTDMHSRAPSGEPWHAQDLLAQDQCMALHQVQHLNTDVYMAP